MLSKLIYRFNTIPIKILAAYHTDDRKVHMEMQGTQKSQHDPEKEQNWRTHTCDFKTATSYRYQDSGDWY